MQTDSCTLRLTSPLQFPSPNNTCSEHSDRRSLSSLYHSFTMLPLEESHASLVNLYDLELLQLLAQSSQPLKVYLKENVVNIVANKH